MKSKLVFVFIFVFLLSACGSVLEPAPVATEVPPTAAPPTVVLPTATPTGLLWPEYTSDAGGFTVKLPTVPTEQMQTAPSAAGDLNIYMHISEENGIAYAVMHNLYPFDTSAMEDTEIDSILDGSRDGAVGGVGGEVTSEEFITIDESRGREIVYTVPDSVISGGGTGYLRLYLVGDMLYQVMAIGPTSGVDVDTVQFFFESFALLH